MYHCISHIQFAIDLQQKIASADSQFTLPSDQVQSSQVSQSGKVTIYKVSSFGA